MRQILFFCALGVLVVLFPSYGFSGTMDFDSRSSSVIFKVKQLAGLVVGGFKEFSGTLEADGAKLKSIRVEIATGSVFTRQLQRDWDLFGPELFDTAAFPSATFVSRQVSGDAVTGDMTFRGKTKPVTLKLTALPPDEKGVSGFALEGRVSRKDFGLTFNRRLDDGKMLLADEVEVKAIVRAGP